jgi:hypothetical protein
MMQTMSRVVLAVVLGVLGVGVVACGSGDGDPRSGPDEREPVASQGEGFYITVDAGVQRQSQPASSSDSSSDGGLTD